jgi:hypothetical protein
LDFLKKIGGALNATKNAAVPAARWQPAGPEPEPESG